MTVEIMLEAFIFILIIMFFSLITFAIGIIAFGAMIRFGSWIDEKIWGDDDAV